MHRHVFLRIVEGVTIQDAKFFVQKPDATGRMGASKLQKCTAAIRMLAYGSSSDVVDEYLKIASSTARECLLHFVEAVVARFGDEYLRKANANDIERLLHEGERRGFPGMMGSIDCTGTGRIVLGAGKECIKEEAKATIILEAVASSDLWIWHAFFGTPGSCNDINVLQRSPVFDDVLQGRAPEVNFSVNGTTYNMGYYLTDGIYPRWSTFIPSIKLPQTPKQRLFTQHQEAVRKDVQRAFGVLQARFAIIRKPALAWNKDILWKIIMACIIMHNMIVEDERDTYQNYRDPNEYDQLQTQNNEGSSNQVGEDSFVVHNGRLDARNLGA
ncbi:uncharacterized protein LOC104897188 [Beta vulgaris subsp. vulgaris]|uniref:uncharacterized protein LOC104897188 n=1 Tax=Beta vulgaris subsp. vulgaris TaxID=3555 RepID=UPI002548A2E7|nr:uncharacterized protein LOC104897188 [Beta vulgaris subsp. vulgaris]